MSTTTEATADKCCSTEQSTVNKSAPVAHDYNELMQMASSLLSGCVPASSSTPNAHAVVVAANAAAHTTDVSSSSSIKDEPTNNAVANFNGLQGKVATSSLPEMQPQNSELRNDVKLSNLFSPNTLQLPLSASKKLVRNSLIGSELNFSPVNNPHPADQCKWFVDIRWGFGKLCTGVLLPSFIALCCVTHTSEPGPSGALTVIAFRVCYPHHSLSSCWDSFHSLHSFPINHASPPLQKKITFGF